ncbi:MAG TPA: hypothetical protein VFI80_11440, partial [Burkholderiales bacterium]|nr:hypothetical protein [Burkholderiales bacterium]
LNPVAVLINKAMIEIPPKFAGKPPVNPESRNEKTLLEREWRGAHGLAEDVRYYGRWMRDEAEKRIGHLYPKVEVTAEMAEERPDLKKYVQRELTVIAWLWVRTVKSPNPAFSKIDVPLASSFILTPMEGREAYIKPLIEGPCYRFAVQVGKPKDTEAVKCGTRARGSRNGFLCLMSGTPIPFEYLRTEAKAHRMGVRLMAVVAEGENERIYLPPTPAIEAVALSARPQGYPEAELPEQALGFRVQEYGMTRWCDLFTNRQLVALTTFSNLVGEAHERLKRDAIAAGMPNENNGSAAADANATTYADAVAIYLGFLVSKLADKGSTICTWDAGPSSSRTATGRSARVATVRVTFARQTLSMTWDFAEVNFFSDSVGSLDTVLKTLIAPLDYLPIGTPSGTSFQHDATEQMGDLRGSVISTDPPYYDNIGYADLSDFFYVWLRKSLMPVFPELFSSVAVPKSEELVAYSYRHGGKQKAEAFFLAGMTRAMRCAAEEANLAFPVTIFYAFKQAESKTSESTASTGWETFLEAVIRAGFGVTGTWPMRTELSSRMRSRESNALASSIVLVCRPRGADAGTATRREFIAELKSEFPAALAELQRGNIAPVDLAQAAIGPGMAVYTRFAQVLDARGNPLSVREALALINQNLDEALAEQEGDFDTDSRWALAWFEQYGFAEGEYGVAETLSKAKNTSVQGLKDAGILDRRSPGGKVRLLRPKDLPAEWDPTTDARLTAWEMVHHLIRVLEAGGESAAAGLVAKLGAKAEVARELCYRLYTLCERKKRAQEALAYNGLVQSWPEIMRLAREERVPAAQQEELF